MECNLDNAVLSFISSTQLLRKFVSVLTCAIGFSGIV
jgi:hypothetical protein